MYVFALCFLSVQYFVRTADSDVERYLNHFTFLSVEEVKQTMEQHQVLHSTPLLGCIH